MNHTILLQRIERCIPKRVPVNIYLKDKQGAYLWCNPYVARTVGMVSNRDIIGKTDNDLPWHDQAEKLRQIDRRVMTCGALEYLERWPASNDIGQKTFLTSKSPCYDEHGNVSGVIGVSVDISRQKRLRTIAQSAERVGSSLFIGQGNHCHCNAEALFYSVKEMVNLAAGFMEMAALNQQTTLAEPKYFSLQALLNMSIASLAPIMIGKGIICHRVLAEGLSPILCGQSLFIHRVIANLLQNSVAVVESGQVIIQASLLNRVADEQTETDIGQTAILSKQGLLKLKMTVIGKQRSPSFHSHGVQINLRLQIAKKIIELIGGRFEFEQLGGRSRIFTCLIPVGC